MSGDGNTTIENAAKAREVFMREEARHAERELRGYRTILRLNDNELERIEAVAMFSLATVSVARDLLILIKLTKGCPVVAKEIKDVIECMERQIREEFFNRFGHEMIEKNPALGERHGPK